MVGHDAPGFHRLINEVVNKPQHSVDYWRKQYGALHMENVHLKNVILQLEALLQISDIYIDRTQQTVRDLIKELHERKQA